MKKSVGFCVLFLVLIVGCAKTTGSEPPMSFGSVKKGGLARSTQFKGFSDEGKDQAIVYAIDYPGHNLKSEATLDLATKAMIKEVFPGRWVIIYQYDGAFGKAIQVPSGFSIYHNAGGGKQGGLINSYTQDSLIPNVGAVYKDASGHEKQVDFGYFEIMPSDMGMGGIGGMSGFGGIGMH